MDITEDSLRELIRKAISEGKLFQLVFSPSGKRLWSTWPEDKFKKIVQEELKRGGRKPRKRTVADTQRNIENIRRIREEEGATTSYSASSMLPQRKKQTKFKLGQTVMTRSISARMSEDPSFAGFISDSLRRHARGDWGDLNPHDKKENEYALTRPLRIFSVYKGQGTKIWIITEADRSATTILFPSDY